MQDVAARQHELVVLFADALAREQASLARERQAVTDRAALASRVGTLERLARSRR